MEEEFKQRGRNDEDDLTAQAVENDKNYAERLEKIKSNDLIDLKLGIERHTTSQELEGFLVNFQPGEIVDDQTKAIIAVVDFYFLADMNKRFKISYPFRPYFYISTTNSCELQVASVLSKKYGTFMQVDIIDKEDLDLKNHLSGIKKAYIKLSFPSLKEFAQVKSELMPLIRKNRERAKTATDFVTLLANHIGGSKRSAEEVDVLEEIDDIREHDVPYHMRVAVDEKLFVAKWYSVKGLGPARVPVMTPLTFEKLPKMPVVLAFDIETTKLPLKFPDSSFDEIMMISYMINGKGYLIINREIVSADINEFEYTPKPEYKGEFKVYNEADEKALLQRFFNHILQVRPSIIVTYNGDFFDWPFVETRAKFHGINMEAEIGFAKDAADEYKSRNCCHMDAFRWVKRDSYLPVGSQNLKAVCKAKLRYDPVELDPELMCKMAINDPQVLATYSVSDAVATYYLYQKYVHPFIFALCTIIPLGPDDVLRKGSGTLCEALLMVEAFHGNIIFPNKHTTSDEMAIASDGRRIESETYVGGHVEALEAGVFRSDIPVRFRMSAEALQDLKKECGHTLAKEIRREYGIEREQLTNFDEVIAEVEEKFDALMMFPSRSENPCIYHLDVGAMYPNIILTNRLQEICLACKFNAPDATCRRTMPWMWRGEIIPATRGEYQQITQQLEGETFGKPPKPFHLLDKKTRFQIEKKRVQDYSKRVYGRTHETRVERRETSICQRENAFYVNTVLAFRDRRYDYKEMLKKAKSQLADAEKAADTVGIKNGQALCVLYESLQLAHKCILNSFYGYVMRKGSRWFSMEMAGIVCHTGANIITEARKLVEKIGKPLELDTDGIWCLLPSSFPDEFTFKVTGWKKDKVTISYPAAMLNALVHHGFTNDQYHRLQDDGSYAVSSENTIYFEVDGPYRCMLLPASKEEGKKLKKRYAVFNFDGTMAELKGFELKRRGELNIIKLFQDGVFRSFLNGKDLESCYKSVARDADKWLNILFSKGSDISDQELFDLISENRSMSRKLEDYGEQKSTSISTAKRLAEFLGSDMVKDAGLACQFIISKFPIGAPVTERAIPLAIFQADAAVRGMYLRKWTKNSEMSGQTDVREILDWQYYIERFGSCVQKIITIPAALQGVENPVPRVAHPDWLNNRIRHRIDEAFQCRLADFGFTRGPKTNATSSVNAHGKRSQANEQADSNNLAELTTVDLEEKENLNPPSKKQKDSDIELSKRLIKKTQAEHGFDEWLDYLKAKWRFSRQEKKQEKAANAVERLIVQTKERTRNRVWQILSVEETSDSGIFNVWAVVDGQMNKVNRTVYLNERERREHGTTCNKILPRGKPLFYLYEHSLDDETYANLRPTIYEALCTQSIEGIYESETPLLFALLLHLGCACRVTGPSSHSIWPLTSLTAVASSDAPYLPAGSVRSIYMYYFYDRTRGFWAFFDAATSEAHIIVAYRGELNLPNMNRLYKEQYATSMEELDAKLNGVREALKFNVRRFDTHLEAEREVNRLARQLRTATTRPTILVVQSSAPRDVLVKFAPNLALFPHVPIHASEPSTLFQAVDWQKITAERIIKHYFYSFIYLEDYVGWARFVNVPIGNLPVDVVPFALDILFGKELKKTGSILWASRNSEPDLGGKQAADLRLVYDWRPFFVDESVVLNNAAFCDTVCVELELGALAVTAVVHKSRLLEAEGTDDTVTFDSTAALPSDTLMGATAPILCFDEGAAVDGAIRTMKVMLQECIREIALNSNKYADQAVLGLDRWLQSSSSLLYDPLITKAIMLLERKLCLFLATEIERLGGHVIHASTSKFIIDTSLIVRSANVVVEKDSCEAARCFTKQLIQALQKHAIFSALPMRVATEWVALLWKDGSNYTGLCLDEFVESDEAACQKYAPQSHWKMCDALPEIGDVRKEFIRVIVGFLVLWMRKKQTATTNELHDDSQSRSSLILGDFSTHIFTILTNLTAPARKELHLAAQQLGFAISEALQCDAACEDAIESLSSQMSRMLGGAVQPITYFGLYAIHDDAQVIFSFLCPLFCRHCGAASNVDISEEQGWTCPVCEKQFDADDVDQSINERLNALHTVFTTQDYACEKCKSVQINPMTQCECGYEYKPTMSADELERNVRAAYDIATAHNLVFSAKLAKYILTSIGAMQ